MTASRTEKEYNLAEYATGTDFLLDESYFVQVTQLDEASNLNYIIKAWIESTVWRINSTLAYLILIAPNRAAKMSPLRDLTNCSYCIQGILINSKGI
ncbi:hypothetical protein [Brunnivagina elsteri]|uniref:Uncharacterized protein n=1 Tax=Brunnivagina elsteri CCALA 953 TaxID=987040 RepID=A0A2A2TPT3_9CYAN|nr:hypothetical protein [Calothrix elsteri]PAX60158.1 hypothetical protein CK510_03290 [Calothrix elsteri CCALA 953]